MRVRCVTNTYKTLPKESQNSLKEFIDNYLTYVSKDWKEILLENEVYMVYAIGFFPRECALGYLIYDGDSAFVVPYQLFEIVDYEIPRTWELRTRYFMGNNEKEIHANWLGYPEFINAQNDPYNSHMFNVLFSAYDNDADDKEIFRQRAAEIDSTLWLPGEKEVVESLFQATSLPLEALPTHIAHRETLPNGVMKTYFDIPGHKVAQLEVVDTQVLDVFVDDPFPNAVGFLIQQKGLVVGWELNLLEGEIIKPIKRISLNS